MLLAASDETQARKMTANVSTNLNMELQMEKGVEVKIKGETLKSGGKILDHPGSVKYKQLLVSQSHARLGGLSNIGPTNEKKGPEDMLTMLKQAMKRRISRKLSTYKGMQEAAGLDPSSKNSISILDENFNVNA